MNQVEAIQVGERYKVQPSYFHRPFIGRVNDVSGSTIVFEVENFELCDQEKIEASRIITVDVTDVKHPMNSNYFFS
ncbi:hypothetical protein C7K38_10620 [Tetragenococcus osmophilus]|uniref:DUF2187 domain-containing protein n=1 Tax=Tetragenococcus osmophilus TaxID=526944 RepID=A0AA38CXA8_9ENTE|nr:hypothetical protein [Tetragenococcus osmophilus]AYW48792.1 hypothetical protein C7K38_10620 [Tetragenococcus osmophilus]GMA54783.1 hypothetical protein GCM10025857_61400 [Alicyclobacillus contaminans]GMA71409.1 hypothetical protein GCM10025885_04580 [Tetragenococcus osmophilus]